MSMITRLFDNKNKILKYHLDWTSDFVKNNIYNIENNYSLYPFRNKWNCNVHTIHDYESEERARALDLVPDTSLHSIDYKFLRKEYEKLAVKVTKKLGIKEYELGDIWYNYYKQGQYQESHTHDGNGGFTAVHYLIFDPQYHTPTLFDDPKIKSPRVKSGDIIFFSNSSSHYVPRNETDKPRLTVAFTLTDLNKVNEIDIVFKKDDY